jgi:chemotaxis protein methyltransferase CheR
MAVSAGAVHRMNKMPPEEIESIEIDILLEGIFRRWGYDFRNYAHASLKRRLEHRLALSKLNHVSELLPKILHDEKFFDLLLGDLSITVTEMFRDPHVYASLRRDVFPVLRTYPFLKIWHAGCATGEEVYSMAVLLKEEGLLGRTQIYATDYNNNSLEIARRGVYPLESIRTFTANYNAAGGKASFSDYYHAKYGSAKIDKSLKENITFAHHNLVADGVFGEMNLIVCRNVMIYFDKTLQNRVLSLFRDSLCHRGYLCLGTKETVDFSSVSDRFETIAGRDRIFRALAETPACLTQGGV